MKIIIGLGNPGEEHKNNRHNAGFMMMNKLRERWNFPDFEFSKKFNALTSLHYPLLPSGEGGSSPARAGRETDEGESDDKNKVLLVKPQTFMNNSGETVRAILDFHKLTAEDILVIHDDLDIQMGKYKMVTDSSAAGHHGVQDIIDKLGTQKFKRVRIGIGQEKDGALVCRLDASDFVLKDFSEEELKEIENVLEKTIEEIPKFIQKTP